MGFSNSKQKTTQQATTTPTNPPWATEAIQAQTGRINDFMARDPASLVAGPSALQERAFAGVDSLGGWQSGNQAASSMAQKAGNAGPNLYGGVQLGPAEQIGPLTQATASNTIDHYEKYRNPVLNDLVKSTLAEYDANTGEQAAALKASGAANKAFGGSRFGIAEGQFAADAGRKRALTDAELRSNAFLQAMGLASQDANRQQDVSLFNTGQDNSRAFANTGANNEFKLAQTGFDAQQGMFNAQAREQALARQLEAAGLTGQLADSAGANSRADLGLTADLGNIQQQIAQAQAYAPAQQLLIGSQALGATPYNLFTGQNVSGTSTTKSSPGLLGAALGIGSMFSPIKIGG